MASEVGELQRGSQHLGALASARQIGHHVFSACLLMTFSFLSLRRENLLTAEVREAACKVREGSLPKNEQALQNVNMITLRSVLEYHGNDVSGCKSTLIAHVLEMQAGYP